MKFSATITFLTLLLGAVRGEAAILAPISYEGGVNAFWITPGSPEPAKPVDGINASQSSSNSFASNKVDLSKAPKVSSYASAALPGGLGGGVGTYRALASSGAGLTYVFAVLGPLATVPVRIVANLSAKITVPLIDLNATSANAYLRIVEVDSGKPVLFSRINASNRGSTEEFRPKTDSYDRYYNLVGGSSYRVEMNAVTTADKQLTTFFDTGKAVAEAFVDPYFEIDPAYAARGYSLAFSDGIRNSLTDPEDPGDPGTPPVSSVPLPASAALLATALAAMLRPFRRAARAV